MAQRSIRILAVHGVGHQERDRQWQEKWQGDWEGCMRRAIGQWNGDAVVEVRFLEYDELFERSRVDPAEVAEALARLSSSLVIHGIGDLLQPRGRGFLEDAHNLLRWKLGMVAQWVADEKLRADLRARLRDALAEFRPDVLAAHSLGSLISYDLLRQDTTAGQGCWFVSFGSQIGNPAVRALFGGRVEPLGQVARWFHLYNREDDVCTARLRIPDDDRFEQVETFFDIPNDAFDHDAERYLSHPQAVERVWRAIAQPTETTTAFITTAAATRALRRKPERRALLVGINDYPNPADRLEGCVNDVFEMSATLQELGFQPENIRTVLNERATAKGIRDRLEWLLDGAGPGDQRVFFYSGHGAQLPGYGGREEVDHMDECLVCHDFDWTPERAITDGQFCELYAQLPYDTHFVAILDACHSGGMTRNGAVRARGLTPPDDIRHRTLRWDADRQMWLPRKLEQQRRKVLRNGDRGVDYTGAGGDKRRIGRGVPLWSEVRHFERAKKDYGHKGPYVPILLEACSEDEYAYEYRHGVASFGAFTYSLTRALKQARQEKARFTFQELVREAAARIKALDYDQHPVLVCPEEKRSIPIPW